MRRTKSIRRQLTTIGILPIVILGISIFVFGVWFIYSISSNAIREELETSTYILKGCFDLTVRGEYTYDKDILRKGNVNISDSTMLYEIKKNSDVDTTIFWGDTRVLSTVENTYGASVVGTKADRVVVQAVLDKGGNYFSDDLIIGDSRYIGYYTPLFNENDSIVGMVFAGKPKAEVYRNIGMAMVLFLLLTMAVLLVSMIGWKKYSKEIIDDVERIKSYLHTIAAGNLNVAMDERIIQSEDEIGEIGIYAEKMCSELKIMVELDSLTMLYNRRICNRLLRKLVESERPFTVVMGDIDFFKRINDEFGHACGDYILQYVSSILKDSVRDCGFASRWGGEEFLLIYEMDYESAKNKIEQLLTQIRECTFEYEKTSIKVTMTFGVKEMDYAVSYEKAIKAADDNLYKGKRDGRNQIVY